MDKVRFGVVGIGNMGSCHSQWLDAGDVSNAVLAACCDINPAKLDNIKKQLKHPEKVAFFDDAEKMFDSGLVDAVIIAVPHYDHPRLSIAALNRGLNVICEKPAGVYTKQVKEMNAVAEKSKGIFAVMFNQRTNPMYKKMRELIRTGVLGEIKRTNWIVTNWYRSQAYYDSGSWRATWAGEGGGVLFNQSPHNIDLFQWITGMFPTAVRAFCHFGKWHDIEVEDDVTAYVEYANGATGAFITSPADTPGTNRFEILGTKGKLVYDSGKLLLWKLDRDEREFNVAFDGNFGEPGSTMEEITVENDPRPEHVRVLSNVSNAILGIEPLYIDGKEGIKGVMLADAMLLSTWLDKKVDLPFDDDLYYEELKKRIATSRLKTTSSDKVADISKSASSFDRKK